MKRIYNLLIFLASSCLLMTFQSCGDDDSIDLDPDTERFSGTWAADQVTLNSFDVTNPEYTDFLILFRPDGSYWTQDGDPIFLETGGFWRFVENDSGEKVILLDGIQEIEVSYEFSDDDQRVTLNFVADGERLGARKKGLDGEYVFDIVRSTETIE